MKFFVLLGNANLAWQDYVSTVSVTPRGIALEVNRAHGGSEEKTAVSRVASDRAIQSRATQQLG
jgi:hypothetical protein